MADFKNRYGTDEVKPRNDAYTGLLTISFFAMLIGCLLLFLDWWGYEGQVKPPRADSILPPLKAVAPRPAEPAPKAAAPKEEKVVPMPDKNKAEVKPAEGKDVKPDAKMDKGDGKEKMDKGKDDKAKDKDKDAKDDKAKDKDKE